MNEEELTFYYNREKRLERAPENVKRFYNGTAPTAPKGLFKALVHTKHSRFMLAAVGISLAVVVLTTLFGAKSNQKNINGVRLETRTQGAKRNRTASLQTAKRNRNKAVSPPAA